MGNITRMQFEELKKEFALACHDFFDDAKQNVKSFALEFAVKVLYSISPESQLVKVPGTDKAWTLTLSYDINGRIEVNTIIVATFKNTKPPKHMPKFVDNSITLSVKHAGLLAVDILGRADIFGDSEKIVLTPLAGALFCRESIPKMVKELNDLGYDDNQEKLLRSIVQSCQYGGHCVKYSEAAIAMAAIETTSKRKKHESDRYLLIGRTIMNYELAGKEFDPKRYKIFKHYIFQDVEELTETFNRVQLENF